MPEEYKSYADCWVERYRASNPERAREIESRGNPSLYPLISNTNCINTAEQSKNQGYTCAEGVFVSSLGVSPIVESAILVRKELHLTQASFARCLSISPRTLRDWEQGRRQPSGAALTLLRWAAKHPEYIKEIHEAGHERAQLEK